MEFNIIPYVLAAVVFFTAASGMVKIHPGSTPQAEARVAPREEARQEQAAQKLRIAAASPLPAPLPSESPESPPPIAARSFMVIDMRSGATLIQERAAEARPIASLTKLATALAVLEADPDFDAPVTIEEGDLRGGGIEHFLVGETVTIWDLLHATLVGSSNTAAAALSRAIDPTSFVTRMNRVAAVLGLKNTVFTEPSGLDPGNISTAYEMSVLARTAFAEPTLKKIVTLPEYVIGRRRIRSTDALLATGLARPPYAVLAGKTGSLGGEIGYHLAAVVDRDAAGPVLVVVLGSSSPGGRFDDAEKLARWAFNNFDWPAYADRD